MAVDELSAQPRNDLVAAPVGHIFCALALLNSGTTDIVDRNAFLAGTSWPDIRYVAPVSRAATHKLEYDRLEYVLATSSAFEAGRRYHVFIDNARERYMVAHNAYAALEKNGGFKTQMLKLIEDRILFEHIKGKVNMHDVLGHIYEEERLYSLRDADVEKWHRLLAMYLSDSHWFHFTRYFKTIRLFREAHGFPKKFFANFWQSLRTIGFFIYAYYQVEMLSRDPDLRALVLDFYQNEVEKIIRTPRTPFEGKNQQHVSYHGLRLTKVTMPRSSSTEYSTNPSFL